MAKKTNEPKDWDRDYLKFRINKDFGSMAAMARTYGVDQSSVYQALKAPYPKVDLVIARALREDPATIWPSRYNPTQLANNPRLWRRWICVNPTTDKADQSVDFE